MNTVSAFVKIKRGSLVGNVLANEFLTFIEDTNATQWDGIQGDVAFTLRQIPVGQVETLNSYPFISRVYYRRIPYSTITGYESEIVRYAARAWNHRLYKKTLDERVRDNTPVSKKSNIKWNAGYLHPL